MFQEYSERGLSVFPCAKESKLSVIKNWQRFCKNKPSEKEIEEWEAQAQQKKYNVAVACGPASDLIVLDIDTDDPDIVSKCPPSPIRRKGKPDREARFFRFSKDIPSRKFTRPQDKAPSIEILTTGRYCMLPPSIHPDTKKPFIWVNSQFESTKDLPFLTLQQIQDIQISVQGDQTHNVVPLKGTFMNEDSQRDSPHGSHNRLIRLSYVLIKKGFTIDDAVDELLEYDVKHHKPIPYFEDKTRGADAKDDPRTNAERFFINIKHHVQRGDVQIPNAIEEEVNNEQNQIISDVRENVKRATDEKNAAYPPAGGVLDLFRKNVSLLARCQKSDDLGLCGALSYMAVLASNRYQYFDSAYPINPNLYCMALARSGVGKDVPAKLLKNLLKHTNLLGIGAYRSGGAMIHNLHLQQNRLDIISEASSLLAMLQDKSTFVRDQAEILQDLFTSSHSFYSGFKNMTKGIVGRCNRPHVSFFATTTPHDFEQEVDQALAHKGLLPRCITFVCHDPGDFNNPLENLKAINEFKTKLDDFNDWFFDEESGGPVLLDEGKMLPFEGHKSGKDDPEHYGMLYTPREVLMNDKARKLRQEFDQETYEWARRSSAFEQAFINRFNMIASKLALLCCLSEFWDDKKILGPEITEKHMLWGQKVVQLAWKKMKSLYTMVSAGGEVEKNLEIIKQSLIKYGGTAKRSEITQKTRSMTRRDRDEALKTLLEIGEISLVKKSNRANEAEVYRLSE